MAKRFTDTDKWKKPFIRGLDTPYKLLWLYILDDCDHAGIWQVDFEVAELKIGERLDGLKAEKLFEKKIEVLQNGEKWLIYDFIEFQYGVLNPTNRVHQSVISIHQRLRNKPLARGLQGAKDKDKEKDKVKNKEKDFAPPSCPEVEIFFSENGYKPEAGKKAWHYYQDADWRDSSGKPVLNWKQKMRGVWFKPENKSNKQTVAPDPNEKF